METWKCGHPKTLENTYIRPASKRGCCRQCKKAQRQAFDRRNSEKVRKQAAVRTASWRRRNPDRARAWAKSHPEQLNENARRWYLKMMSTEEGRAKLSENQRRTYYRMRIRTVAGPEILAQFKAWEADQIETLAKRFGAKAIETMR